MTTDTPTTDNETPQERQVRKLDSHITGHNAGLHAGSFRPAACAGCLLSGALETEVVGE